MNRALIAALLGAGGLAEAQSPPPPAPILHAERDPDGAFYLRVEDPKAGAPDKPLATIADRTEGPDPGKSFVPDARQVRIANFSATKMKYGLSLKGAQSAWIYNYRYWHFDGAGSPYGGAIKIGDNKTPIMGSVYIRRVAADGGQKPDATYKLSNTDFIGVERGNGPIYIRDVTGGHFGDAGIDAKSDVYVMNATLYDAHRIIRVWGGATVTLVNSIVNAAPGHAQVWLGGPTARLRYFNVLWCVGADTPSRSNPACRPDPSLIEGEDAAQDVAKQVTAAPSNPLKTVDPFFVDPMTLIRIDYSVDGGANWKPTPLADTGSAGDRRFRLDWRLVSPKVRFRARYQSTGGAWSNNSAAAGLPHP